MAVKWDLVQTSAYDAECVMRARIEKQAEAAAVLKQVQRWVRTAYQPLDIDELTTEEIEEAEKQGRWIDGRNFCMPSAQYFPFIVLFNPADVLSDNPMQFADGGHYEIDVPLFDIQGATAFTVAFVQEQKEAMLREIAFK